ncbi:fungal-specific transcription factor domain-containing protein, partial [Bisporella sp. PMI_857]
MEKSLHRFRISKAPTTTNRGSDVGQDSEVPTSQSGTSPSNGTIDVPTVDSDVTRRRILAQPACERCRRMKRKCSKTRPACTLCLNSGLQCSFSEASVPPIRQARQLQARVEWLSRYIDEKILSGGSSVECLETGADISMETAKVPTPTHENDTARNEDAVSLEEQTSSMVHPPQARLLQRMPVTERMPDKSAALIFAEAYFRHIHRSYPFMDQAKVMADMKGLGIFQPQCLEKIPTKLYILMAIGCTTLQRIGQVPDSTVSKFNIAYPNIIRQCLLVDDIDSVQTCLLLGLYSLFEPSTIWPWKITGVLTRQVIRMGLSRQAFVHEDLGIRQVEMRHRLFWSVWTLDRIVSATLGLPFGIHDDNINVPLPSITLEEYSSSEASRHTLTLQINRHVIALRRLEEQILQRIHFTDSYKSTSLSLTDKKIVIQELRSKIENWYTHGCLVTPQERDAVPFHNTIPWLNFRYQNLLLLLYSPSHFNSSITDSHLKELQSCAQKYIQLSGVLFEHRHMPMNYVTMCRFVALTPILLFCIV